MKINITGKSVYVPKWNGNRLLPAEQQVSVEYRYLTCDEEEKFSKFVPRYKGEKKDEMELEIKTNANEIWDLCVQKVNGLVDDAGTDITDPKALRKVPGTYELVTEIVALIRKGISEEELKN